MAADRLYIDVDGLDKMVEEFGNAAGPIDFKVISKFEKTFHSSFLAVRGRTHVDTGYLRFSGITRTHFDGDEWSGEIAFARNPGIFELARGDTPTYTHPEGGHFFFNAVEAFIPELQDHVESFFRDAFNEGAPI